jgi:hypothetical protein
MSHTLSWPSAGWRDFVKEGLERHADDIRRPAAEAARRSPERTTERGGHTDGDLILQDGPPPIAALRL